VTETPIMRMQQRSEICGRMNALSEQTPTRKRATRRTDEQLIAMMHDVVAWAVNDKRGKVLYRAASLRDAIREAMVYQAASNEPITVRQQPSDLTIVSRAQIQRLAEAVSRGT
jgi:hypothetical protein